MAYCTITEVRELNPKRTYDGSSTPTQTQVESMVDRIASELDSLLSARGLTVPVTEPAAFLAHLKQVNALGAAAQAEMGMFPESGGMGASTHGAELWRMYREARDALRTGDLPVTVEGDIGPRSYGSEHPSTNPKFTKDQIF